MNQMKLEEKREQINIDFHNAEDKQELAKKLEKVSASTGSIIITSEEGSGMKKAKETIIAAKDRKEM